jgi:hypothetical protein
MSILNNNNKWIIQICLVNNKETFIKHSSINSYLPSNQINQQESMSNFNYSDLLLICKIIIN